ncbi:ArsR/SmtB family transcription factor [Plantactinospora endophytica]|uniref:Transcriptional regulator n=1 Tax=Plantactinospora endophytica TaxID=673535 RepID=A0ABQ4EE10_9ACTN|nr:winged helix-turn-helix domain-containing protein [Plantactinospora endophytica]GIG92491.1 transcriptional regulator [Plantactinospora endophytica]
MDSERSNQSEPPPSVVALDSAQIRVLAHPLRARLLIALRSDGPATATRLAQALGTNTGATSYHLRQLADAGLVVEEPDLGAGRQRWWRAAHQFSSWRSTDFADDPDALAAADWLYRHAIRLHADLTERWVTEQHTYPAEWRDAANFSDVLLRLDPPQLRQLNDELHAVIDRYRHAVPAVDGMDLPEPGDGTEQVLLYLHSFPVRGPIPLAGGVEENGERG